MSKPDVEIPKVKRKYCKCCRSYRFEQLFLNDSCMWVKSCIICRLNKKRLYKKKLMEKKEKCDLAEFKHNVDKIMDGVQVDQRSTLNKPTVEEMMTKINNVGVDNLAYDDFAPGYSRSDFA